jgi:hypothetical protein
MLPKSEINFCYDQSKEDEMSGACGVHGGGEGCIQHFGWEALKGGYHKEDLGIDGRTTL